MYLMMDNLNLRAHTHTLNSHWRIGPNTRTNKCTLLTDLFVDDDDDDDGEL